jgi:hypothetical protein
VGSRHGQAGSRGDALPDAADQGPAPWIAAAPLLADAYWLAESAHRSQRRPSDGRPFLDHVVEVATLLHEAGFDEELIAVGLLHDAVERGTLTAAELRLEMGGEICSLVLALSEDPSIQSFDERKAGLRQQVRRAGGQAVTIFAADKLSDILGLRRGIESGNGVEARIGTTIAAMAGHYRESVEVIESDRPGSVFLPALRVQLDRLAAEAQTPSARSAA